MAEFSTRQPAILAVNTKTGKVVATIRYEHLEGDKISLPSLGKTFKPREAKYQRKKNDQMRFPLSAYQQMQSYLLRNWGKWVPEKWKVYHTTMTTYCDGGVHLCTGPGEWVG